MTADPRARSFDRAAAQYAENRPSYPVALLDAVEELAGRPLPGTRVADVGAGTGIATALLGERGARVVAVEPGEGMAAVLRARLPGVPLVRGDGNALPLADRSQDLITYAQSWHWTDPVRSVPEAMRVLRPGGALALWWNTSALDVPWIAAQHERLTTRLGPAPRSAVAPLDAHSERLAELAGLTGRRRRLRWSRHVPMDTHLANLASHSSFLVRDEHTARAFLDAERDILSPLFPDGVVEEVYSLDLLVATRP